MEIKFRHPAVQQGECVTLDKNEWIYKDGIKIRNSEKTRNTMFKKNPQTALLKSVQL